ncbi:MAG: hypothetical protein IKN41_07745 [Candidatus Methanomethylophilaceae archaeon]|nr:hypothetical protein [Candidatus Methanomethylophilaceae archaeon]
MEKIFDFQPSILSIQYHVGIAEQMPRDEMESTLRELFDETAESYKDFPGMQCIISSMALGDIRYMESENAEYAAETWSKWMDDAGIQPWNLPKEDVGRASKIVYGREDAFVWQKP